MARKPRTPDPTELLRELDDTVRRIGNMRYLMAFKERRRDELVETLRAALGRDTARTEFIDFDARRDPKTGYYCPMCQKDIQPDSDHVEVRLILIDNRAQPHALHADDELLVDLGVLRLPPGAEDEGRRPMGRDCARRMGKGWTMPRRDNATATRRTMGKG